MPTISYETIIWTIRYTILAIVMLSVLTVVSWVMIMNINVQEIESEVFISRVVYSENINYVDSSGRIHPGTIDMDKFYPGNLDLEVIYPEEKALAAKLTLYENDESKGTVYYNKEWFLNWEPLKSSSGKGGVSFVRRTVSVLVKDKGELRNGILDFEVIMPNT